MRGPVAWQRRCLVEAPGVLKGLPRECGWNRCQGKKGRKKKEQPRTGYCRIYSRSFLDNPLIKKMREDERELPFLVL